MLTILALVLAALMALAWPLSQVGVGAAREDQGLRRSIRLVDGALWLRSETIAPPKPLGRPRYTVGMGGARAGTTVFPLPRVERGTASTDVVVPLLGIMGVAGLSAGALLMWPAWRLRRRLKRGLCAGCGYQRSGDGACPECGKAPADAEAAARLRIGPLARDASVVLFAAVLAACLGAWEVVRLDEREARASAARAFDYSWYLNVCGPRLSGTVAVARPGTGPDSLTNLVGSAGDGGTIVLLPGHHDLFKANWGNGRGGGTLKNVWLLGCGAETTSLSLRLVEATGVRIEGVTIECQDNPFTDIRDGGSMELRDCRVNGYNSGAGGSDSIFGSGMALLVEGCEFEGKSGRASGSGQVNASDPRLNVPGLRGNAFDLRGENRVFMRGSRFIDNQSVFRDADGVLDGCTVSVEPRQMFTQPNGGRLYLRGTQLPASRSPGSSGSITETVDDPAVLRRLADGAGAAAWTDPVARKEVDALRLARDPAFWGRLLRHPSAEIRALAAAKSGGPAAPVSTIALEDALAGLDKRLIAKDVALAVLAGGEAAKAALEAKRTGGKEQERANAAGLLRLMEMQPSLPELLRYELWRAGR